MNSVTAGKRTPGILKTYLKTLYLVKAGTPLLNLSIMTYHSEKGAIVKEGRTENGQEITKRKKEEKSISRFSMTGVGGKNIMKETSHDDICIQKMYVCVYRVITVPRSWNLK